MIDPREYLIYPKLMSVMEDMQSLSKTRENTQQGYKFRGIDDVYNMVQPIMAKHGIVMSSTILADSHEERTTKSGSALIYRILKIRYSFIAIDGSRVETEVIGEGMDTGDKATNKAMSVAQKYALLQTFMIPTEDPKDPEHDSPQPAAKNKPVGQVAKTTVPPPAEQKKPEGPASEAQVKEIAEAASYLMGLLKKTEAEILATIQAKVKKHFAVDIAETNKLTEPQATWVIKSLWTAIQKEGTKKANELANKVRGSAPTNDGAPGGPSDPSEGAQP